MTALNQSKERADIDIQSIVEQVQSGDTRAYAEIIRCFQKQIYIYCYYMLGTKEEAEDASQDIFIKGLENIHKFSYTVSLSAWLYKIAHHHCIDVIKAKNKGYKFWLNLKQEQVKQTQVPIPEYDEMVHRLLENLHVDEKRILLLHSIEEYSFDEIAAIMDMKAATVRKKYERLRKKLMKENMLGGIFMDTRSKLEDKELDQIERFIRETPIEVDLVNRTMNKYENKRNSKQPESFRTHKKMRQRVMMMTASAAMIFSLVFITGLISPTMAATMKEVPVLSSIFKLAGDLGLKTADEKGLSTKLHTSVTKDGFTLSVSEVVYDGTRVSIAIERLQTEGEFSKRNLIEQISDIELFINGNSVDSFAANDSNSVHPMIHNGKDKDSAIIEFSDLSNQGGASFPEQFNLTLFTSITGIEDPLKIDIPVKNKVEDYVTLQPNVSRKYDNIHFTVEQIQLTPITTGITTRLVLMDNSTFTLPLLTMGIDVFDDQGRKLKLIGGNGWHATNGSDKITDSRYNPFESVPKTITLKPYIYLFDENEMGAFQMDENGEPKIQYIPELEVTLPINSQK